MVSWWSDYSVSTLRRPDINPYHLLLFQYVYSLMISDYFLGDIWFC